MAREPAAREKAPRDLLIGNGDLNHMGELVAEGDLALAGSGGRHREQTS
jgi:hypothetical protein